MTSLSILCFQATETLPLMTKAHSLCIIHERLLCLFIVCETMFTIGESRTISHPNDTQLQAQQVPANPCRGRFPLKLLWRTPTKIHPRVDRSRQSAKQREHRLAQRRQHRQHSDHKHVQRQ